MSATISRREALQRIGAAGGVVLSGGILRGQARAIRVGRKPVEILIASVSSSFNSSRRGGCCRTTP